MEGLHENSKAYYDACDVYEIFSKAEDKPNKTFEFLKEKVRNKKVLDIGCGTGKYAKLLSNFASEYFGIDKSNDQLKIAKNKKIPNATFICADASSLPFEDNSFDIIIACWMLGTVLDNTIQAKILQEAKRVLNHGGRMYFIENDEGGKFEIIRGRCNGDNRTKTYNDFLKNNGFTIATTCQTEFQFEDLNQAKTVFKEIWNEEVANHIKSEKIEHNIIIFEFKKD